MRLVCPNCGAQYEVDERVIPDSGRDVQCSACGHAWYQLFQAEPDNSPDEVTSHTDDDDVPADEHADHEASDAHEAEQSPEVAEPESEPEPEDAAENDEDDHPIPAHAAMPRPAVDDSVRGILQEEAERELSARAGERDADPVETQPDLGIDDAQAAAEEERRRIARERMARMRDVDEDDDLTGAFGELPDTDDTPAQPAPQPNVATDAQPPEPQPDDISSAPRPAPRAEPMHRRDLFPDIEEINSTLDGHDLPSAALDGSGGAGAERGAGGFGRGFFFVVLIMVLALIVYILAPTLIERIPALDGVLSAYVDAVNSARVWLESTLQSLIGRLESAATGGAQ